MGIGYQKEIDNNPQSQTSPLFSYHMMRVLDDTLLLASDTSVDATTINLAAGHGFTGANYEYLTIFENNRFLQQEISASQISGNVITLKEPLDYPFTTAAKVIRGNINLVTDYSSAEQDVSFEFFNGTVPIDFGNIIFISSQTVDTDDGDFFGVEGGLDDGLYFRIEDGNTFNLGNYKTNLDFRKRGASVEYIQKAPAGNYSTIINVPIEGTFGQVIRIDPRANTILRAHLRDNITGITLFMDLNGSYTSGE